MVFIGAVISAAVIIAGAGGEAFRLVEHPQSRDIGAPVKSVNWVNLHEGKDRDGRTTLFVTMGQTADNLFVLAIDPDTGALRQFVSTVKESNYPTSTLLARDGNLYIGSAYAGHLLRYDPKREKLEDLGAINPGAATFPCAMDEDAGGRIWIGSYGTADLTSYDPRAGTFTRHGRMDDTDMYNYPMVNADGTICCRIMMTRPHLVVFDPKTGEKRTVGPVTEKGKDSFELRKGGDDGAVYIGSNLGNFRVSGFNTEPVASIPPLVRRPQSHGYRFLDGDQQLYRTLQVSTGNSTRVFTLDYTSAGTEIFLVHRGPDGKVYGSSILPLHLFRFDPSRGDLADLGKCSAAAGEAYSMANWEGKLYIASYPQAMVSIYDPAKPYRYGTGPEDNPTDLGRIDDISYRPRSALAGPLGRIWFASLPDYGQWGGPLSWYEPATGKKGVYHRIAGDGSCYTLAWLEKPGLMAVGTTIQGGTGTQPKAKQAMLFLWDYRAEKKVWEGTLDRPVETINALLALPDGRIFGTASGGENHELFAFDPASRAFTARTPLPAGSPLDKGLQLGPDGYIYGFTSSCIYRVKPTGLAIEEIVREDDGFSIPGPIVGNDIYFARGHILKAMKLFE
jgi:outer membrane protein assembly factor BamB